MITQKQIVEILEKIEMTFDKNKKVAIFWLDEKIITPKEFSSKLLSLFSQYQAEQVKAIEEVLKGIDKDETESDDGWWNTSTGGRFGKKKLAQVLSILNKRQ